MLLRRGSPFVLLRNDPFAALRFSNLYPPSHYFTALFLRELSIVLDMVPPLAVDKSVPATLEARLKAYAAEVVALRTLHEHLHRLGSSFGKNACCKADYKSHFILC